MLDLQLKQRLLGATVIVALGVIFLPMLLDGSGVKPKLADLPAVPVAPDVPMIEPKVDPALVEQAKPVAEPLAETKPTLPLPVEKPVIDAPPLNEEPPATVPPAPRAVEVKPEVDSWVVQVASLNDQTKAVALRDRLRGGGFTAFVESYAVNGQPIYRVRVGPFIKRELADAVSGQIAAQDNLKGIVVKYP